MLRDILRRHAALAATEKTHFYRWADPFGTPRYTQQMVNNRTLIRHRGRDGIEESEFATMIEESTSRAELYDRYMAAYIEKNKPTATRWFDKTPQNVYGAALLAGEFPASKLIHIVRDPRDVAASLKLGKVMHVVNVVGACSYWLEAVRIMRTVAKAWPSRVYEVRYEDLTAAPEPELRKLMTFINEDYSPGLLKGPRITPKSHDGSDLFTAEERAEMQRLCGETAKRYGYLD